VLAAALLAHRPRVAAIEEDLNRGNYWGWPALAQLVDNYATVLTDSRLPQFVLNSFLVTIPAVVGTVAFASMAGFALAKHEFRGSRLLLMVFIGGNLVPFQALMIPVRDLIIGSASTIRVLRSSCFTWHSRPASARSSCATSFATSPTTRSMPRASKARES
jgi:ABC-type glycerol-3-phosphate transport system permease component